MKFHSIRLENLNSLYGEHGIDFEADVRNAPLFLIVGQTGAGKSTILDGVSLALFGKTPRLEQQRGAADTDVGHIMSVGTAHAAAELVFSVRNADGTRERYRAEWSCRRAHDSPEGTLQRPERALSVWRDGAWELIVSDHRQKEFEGPFAKALRGLTVEDFRRTILLAQGDFSALLHASDEEKAAILERLTNTEIYQEIGSRAASRRRDAERAYHSLKKELEQTEVLDAEAREKLERQMSEVVDFESDAAAELASIDEAIERERRREALVSSVEEAKKHLKKTVEAYADLQPKIDRLEIDRRFRVVEPAFRELESAESGSEAAAKDLESAKSHLDELSERLKEALSERDKRIAALEALETSWAKLAPRLEKAGRLEAKMQAALEELEKARRARKRAEDAYSDQKENEQEARARLDEAKKALKAAEDARQKLPTDSAVEGLKAKIHAHVERAVMPAFERLDELQPGDEEGASVNLTALRSRRTKTRNQLLEIAGDLEELDALSDQLAVAIAERREERDALTEATYAMAALKQRESERSELSDKIEKLDRELEVAKGELESTKAARAEARVRTDELRRALRLAEQMLAISELRGQLEDGEPCPLCGSPIHPFCLSDELEGFDTDARAERDDFAERLTAAEEGLEKAERKVSLQETSLATKLASRQHYSGSRVEVVEKLEHEKRRFAQAAEKGGFPPLEVWNLRQGDRLSNALDAAKRDLTELEERAEQLRIRRGDWERAVEDLRVAEQTESDSESRVKLLARARESLESRVEELGGMLEPLGIERPSPSPASVERAVGRADEVFASIQEASATVTASRRTAEKAAAAAEKSEDARKRAEEALAEAEKEVVTRSETVEELKTELSEVLPEGKPSSLREEHAASVEKAREAVAKARARAEKIQSDRDERAGKLKERFELYERATKTLAAAKESWNAAIEEREWTRSEVAKGLLSLETRSKLEQEVEKARDARDRAKGAVESVEKSLESFTEDHPDKADLQELKADRARVANWRDAFTQQRGALRERKEQDDRRRAAVADRQEELARLRAESDRWSTIAKLIGTGDGAAFRTFAQSLNLQGLVDRANARLEHLAPRYELTVARGEQGEPTLDFAVRDAFKAGYERPLTTLSGGETFLVSLALALALSDYRRIELPVETLLLDEGFGTLDQDALHMAVDTLQRLHQDSTRQVGIISHVEALKEMIDARIVVEKEGNGRSRLRFEVGGVATSGGSDGSGSGPGTGSAESVG